MGAHGLVNTQHQCWGTCTVTLHCWCINAFRGSQIISELQYVAAVTCFRAVHQLGCACGDAPSKRSLSHVAAPPQSSYSHNGSMIRRPSERSSSPMLASITALHLALPIDSSQAVPAAPAHAPLWAAPFICDTRRFYRQRRRSRQRSLEAMRCNVGSPVPQQWAARTAARTRRRWNVRATGDWMGRMRGWELKISKIPHNASNWRSCTSAIPRAISVYQCRQRAPWRNKSNWPPYHKRHFSAYAPVHVAALKRTHTRTHPHHHAPDRNASPPPCSRTRSTQ